MSNIASYGIDLGTTNSCAACYDGDSFRIFQNNDLMNVTPSVVRVLRNGRIIVGRRAHNALVEDPQNVALEFKRWMGQKDKKLFPSSQRQLSAEELSAEVLKSITEDVNRATGGNMRCRVITVPAAFGTLQCEATARGAQLAGIPNPVLLQEPIAAAIAYGITPDSRDERWLVYDLGGGTLDIAVISTREGRLAVLEHRGDARLGGKDIDRHLVEQCLIPALAEAYALPNSKTQPREHEILFRRLTAKAEEAKIELSSCSSTLLSLFDIGCDVDGKPIEIEIPLTRRDVEHVFEPLMRRTLQLTDDALAAARLSGRALNRVLLVGGPTQMPILRESLRNHFSVPVDHSLDPLTVVACGAALYATTVGITRVESKPRTVREYVEVQLAHEPVSARTTSLVAGRLLWNGDSEGLEVRVESQAGYWTSGWMGVTDGAFEVEVHLQEAKICPFYIYVRDSSGVQLAAEPSEFVIRHGLELPAPPLPHSISVEVIRPNGRIELDPVFPRHSPLPVERRIVYRADRNLKPTDSGDALTVKLWEGEDILEPEANEWVGNVQLTSAMIRRSIPEDSELELFIKIDVSRLITVEIFIPHLNQHFSENLYLPEREQSDGSSAARALTKDLMALGDRLVILERHVQEHAVVDAEVTLSELRERVAVLDIELTKSLRQNELNDPDRTSRLVAAGKELKACVAALEHRVGAERSIAVQVRHVQDTVRGVQETVEKYGTKLHRFEFEMLRIELEKAAGQLDERGVRRSVEDLRDLDSKIKVEQDWYWRDAFESMDKRDTAFIDPAAARYWIAQGEAALTNASGLELREAVRKLFGLLSTSAGVAARQSSLRTGLRS